MGLLSIITLLTMKLLLGPYWKDMILVSVAILLGHGLLEGTLEVYDHVGDIQAATLQDE